MHSSPLLANMKKKTASTRREKPEVVFFLFPFPSLLFHPLSSHPHHHYSLILSQSASAHELKVDSIRPALSRLNTRLPRLRRSALCGGDNGSNYTGSMSVPQRSAAAREGCGTAMPATRPHPHTHTPSSEFCCSTVTIHTHTHSGDSLLKGLHTVTWKHTPGRKMCFFLSTR